MCSQIRKRNGKNLRIYQFWGREFILLSQKYEEKVRKAFFLVRHHFKAELHRDIYIVMFGKHLSEIGLC